MLGFKGAAANWPRSPNRRWRGHRFHLASMGPRPIGRGVDENRTVYLPLTPLQWGRGQLAAESQNQYLEGADPVASMGPRPIGRGVTGSVTRPPVPGRASMGPRPIGRGVA